MGAFNRAQGGSGVRSSGVFTRPFSPLGESGMSETPFSCADISTAVFKEIPAYRAAKAVYEASLSVASGIAKSAPVDLIRPDGTKLPRWKDIKERAAAKAIEIGIAYAIMGPTRAFYEQSLARIGFLNLLWEQQSCWNWAQNPDPGAPGGGGGGGGGRTITVICQFSDFYDPDNGQYLGTRTDWCIAVDQT